MVNQVVGGYWAVRLERTMKLGGSKVCGGKLGGVEEEWGPTA